MLSICVALKNRSRVRVDGRELRLFPNCVESIRRSVDCEIGAELVVADWSSDDWPLDEWLTQALEGIPLRVVRLDGHFSRGKGLNSAAAAARSDALLFIDADVLLCRSVLERGVACVSERKAFFPVVYCFDSAEHRSGWWEEHGYGICMLDRAAFERAGRWPEYSRWGKEDDDFFARVSQVTAVVREKVPGFFHQWHPDDILWKDQYADRDPADIEEIKQSRIALQEVAAIVPPGTAVIFVDEARFGVEDISGRPALPFLEKNGEYAGPPEDDAVAIAELRRMRNEGARFLVIAWPAFWWLQHYSVFAKHLSKYRLVIQNDRLVVFDLTTSNGLELFDSPQTSFI